MKTTKKPLRVPLNCFISPTTKEAITALQNTSKESQGEIVDRAIALLTVGEELPVRPRKLTKGEALVNERASGDLTAQAAERQDIDYRDVESAPTTHITTLKANVISPGTRSLQRWREGRKPIVKPKDRKE